jgi:hypothetical protein
MPVPAVPSETCLEPLERETIPRVARRLLPLLMLGYFCAYLDRVNVGFAGLTMNKALDCWLFGSLLRTLAVLCTQQR